MKRRLAKEKPIDRRIRKTKRLLTDALVDLIVEKGYEGVTVKDIINRAKVGRSTFYAHFEDKDQLLLSGHDAFRKILSPDLLSSTRRGQGSVIDFPYLYRHVYERSELAAAMGTHGEKIMHDHLRAIFALGIDKTFGRQGGNEVDKRMFAYTADAAASAMVTLLFRWIQEGMPASPESMAAKSEALLARMMNVE